MSEAQIMAIEHLQKQVETLVTALKDVQGWLAHSEYKLIKIASIVNNALQEVGRQ
jgi:hypothetical protein